MELRVGGKVAHFFNHAAQSPIAEEVPEKYQDHCGTSELLGRITAIDPPRLLAYSWNEGEASVSEVTFELEAKGDVTQLINSGDEVVVDPEAGLVTIVNRA